MANIETIEKKKEELLKKLKSLEQQKKEIVKFENEKKRKERAKSLIALGSIAFGDNYLESIKFFEENKNKISEFRKHVESFMKN